MSDADVVSDGAPEEALVPEFEPPAREAWLALVAKVLKGGDFEKRLVARTADGIPVQPLYTRGDAIVGAEPTGRTAYFPGGWDIRQRHAEPDAGAANAAILDDLAGGATSLVLQIKAPGQSGLSYAAEPLAVALKGVFLDGCAVALDARENTMDAAGSLIEIWRAAGIGENRRRGAFNCDPLGVLARTGTLYYPAQRSCEIAAKFAYDCRSMSHVAALLADGRPYHEAGAGEAQELAAMLATLVAYLRACEGAGLQAALCLRQDRAGAGGGRRPVPDDCQAARGTQARRPRRRGVRRHACRRPHAPVGRHLGAHAGAARSLGEHAAHHHRLRRRGARRRRRRHRAALHLGARQARRLRPPHRPQHAPGAAGGKLARPRHGPGARRLVHREDDGRAGAEELGAVPGHRGQGRHGRSAGERVHPGRDRQDRRGAGRRASPPAARS